MNQHVQLLVQQAQILTDKFQEQWKAGPSTEEFFHEKFAELIVQECAAICRDTDGEDNMDARSGRQDCAVEIQEHFGVKE